MTSQFRKKTKTQIIFILLQIRSIDAGEDEREGGGRNRSERKRRWDVSNFLGLSTLR